MSWTWLGHFENLLEINRLKYCLSFLIIIKVRRIGRLVTCFKTALLYYYNGSYLNYVNKFKLKITVHNWAEINIVLNFLNFNSALNTWTEKNNNSITGTHTVLHILGY